MSAKSTCENNDSYPSILIRSIYHWCALVERSCMVKNKCVRKRNSQFWSQVWRASDFFVFILLKLTRMSVKLTRENDNVTSGIGSEKYSIWYMVVAAVVVSKNKCDILF